jgi:hypothetical protein
MSCISGLFLNFFFTIKLVLQVRIAPFIAIAVPHLLNRYQTQALLGPVVVASSNILASVAQYFVFLLVSSTPVADGGK